MIDIIEAKIKEHIESILKKDAIHFWDYQTLVNEIARQSTREQAEKWNAEKEQRNKSMMEALKGIWM